MTSVVCPDVLACGSDARLQIQRVSGSISGSGNRREYFLSRSKSLHTTHEHKLFVSLSVKVTVCLASGVVIRFICAYCKYFVPSSGLLLFVDYNGKMMS